MFTYTFWFTKLQTEGEDELKKRQLMELAIINGTYRDGQRNGLCSLPNFSVCFNVH